MSHVSRCALLAAVGVAFVAGLARAADPKGKPSKADEPAVKELLAYFEKNKVTLRFEKDGEWVVSDPKTEGYLVVVHLRTFPADATAEQMKDELRQINLAYLPNVKAKLAMSHPGLRSTDPKKPLPKLDDVKVVAELKTLFEGYQPSEPKK